MAYVSYVDVGESKLKGGNYVLAGPLDQIFRDVVGAGEKVITDEGGDAIEKALRTTQFAQVLDAVEGKAREGVKKEASKNALALFGLAVGAGAVGGAIFTGKVGTIIATGLMAASVIFMMKNAADTAKK